MSDIVKGKRKTKTRTGMGASANGFQLSPELVIAALMAGIYALFLVETKLEQGLNALILSSFLVLAFLVYKYLMNRGTIQGQQKFGSLINVFLGLAVLSLALELLRYSGIIDPARIGTTMWAATVGLVSALLSIAIIAVIMYFEKISLNDIYVRAGDTKVIIAGVAGFILSVILGILAAYFIFGGYTLGHDRLLQIILSVIVFAVISGAYEELWFRGLLLNRIKSLIGESQGNIYQALVFGVFESLVFYMITAQASLLPAMFIIGAMTGYYWGRATLKSNSLITSALLHAGLYILLTVPLIIALQS